MSNSGLCFLFSLFSEISLGNERSSALTAATRSRAPGLLSLVAAELPQQESGAVLGEPLPGHVT